PCCTVAVVASQSIIRVDTGKPCSPKYNHVRRVVRRETKKALSSTPSTQSSRPFSASARRALHCGIERSSSSAASQDGCIVLTIQPLGSTSNTKGLMKIVHICPSLHRAYHKS